MGRSRLSALDNLFLDIESVTQPMHVGALLVLDGEPLRDAAGRIQVEEVRRTIASRLHLVPRFRQRIIAVPFGAGRPVWADDRSFDIADHVHVTSVSGPGGLDQLRELIRDLLRDRLARDRPLWEMWLVDGVADDGVGLVFKAHHCMLDGVSGIDVALALLDLEPDPERDPGPRFRASPRPLATELLTEGVTGLLDSASDMIRGATDVLRSPRTAVDRLTEVVDSATSLGDTVPVLPWNAPVGAEREYATARVPLNSLRRAREVGATVNDAVLTVCAEALAAYLGHLGVEVAPDLTVRAIVPVSVRAADEHLALGNRVAAMLAALPVGELEPTERLRRVSDEMRYLKSTDQADTTVRLIDLVRHIPPALSGPLTRVATRYRAANLIITNIPGPDVPLWFARGELREIYPYVGIMDNCGLTISVISYRGELGFGLVSDPALAPDLGVLAKGIEAAAHDLADLL